MVRKTMIRFRCRAEKMAVAVGVIVLFGSTVGCQSGGEFGGGGSNNAKKKSQAADAQQETLSAEAEDGAAKNQEQSVSKNDILGAIREGQIAASDTQNWEKLVAQSMGDVVYNAIQAATNEPIDVMGYHFENRRDRLLEAESAIMDSIADFATLGEFIESRGVHGPEDVTLEMVERSLQISERFFNGEIDDGTEQASVGGDSKENLGFRLGVGCSAAGGAVGGLVGALCEGTITVATAGAGAVPGALVCGAASAATSAATAEGCNNPVPGGDQEDDGSPGPGFDDPYDPVGAD